MSILSALTDTSDKNVLNLLLIKDIEDGRIVRKNGGYIGLYQITTKDFSACTEDEIEYDIFSFAKFYRLYANDIKIITMNFPVDTKTQRQYFSRKISQTNNEVFKYHLRVRYNQLEYIEKNLLDKEFYLMIFASDIEDYKEKDSRVNSILINSGLTEELSEEKKRQILFKLCNKCTSIFD